MFGFVRKRFRKVGMVVVVMCAMLYIESVVVNMKYSMRFQEYVFGKATYDTKECKTDANVPANKSVSAKASQDTKEYKTDLHVSGIKSVYGKGSQNTKVYKTDVNVPGNKSLFGMASLDTKDHIKEVKVDGDRSVFISLSNAVPTDDWKSYDKIVITTWDNTVENDSLTCCLLYHNGNTKQVVSTKTAKTGAYVANNYFCDISNDNGELPWKVTLIDTRINVCSNTLNATRIFYPVREPKKFAICTKVIFGKFPPFRLVEWMEYHKMMGVDRVVTFYTNSFHDNESRKILSHYEKEGLLKTYYVGTPADRTRHLEKIVKKDGQNTWSSDDEHIATQNCFYKLMGYDLVAIMDWDEFIVMSDNVTVKSYFLQKLYNSSTLSSMSFYLEFFIKNWGKSANHSDLLTRSYFNRTKPLTTTSKYIFVPPRVIPWSVKLHHSKPRPPYRSIWIPPEDAIIHHYRFFANRLKRHGELDRFTDYQMKRYGPELEKQVSKVLSAV